MSSPPRRADMRLFLEESERQSNESYNKQHGQQRAQQASEAIIHDMNVKT